VLRKLRKKSCECKYAEVCAYKMKEETKIEIVTPELLKGKEKEYVYDVYDQIAEHFHHTRHNMWPQVKSFLESFNTGSLICDIGTLLTIIRLWKWEVFGSK